MRLDRTNYRPSVVIFNGKIVSSNQVVYADSDAGEIQFVHLIAGTNMIDRLETLRGKVEMRRHDVGEAEHRSFAIALRHEHASSDLGRKAYEPRRRRF